MIAPTNSNTVASAPAASSASHGFGSLGQADFLRLLTVQVQQQDPFEPVDNKEMLAQMAQFSSLSGISEMGDTLKQISTKLDNLAPVSPAPQTGV